MLKRAKTITVTGSKSKAILVKNGINQQKIHCLPNSLNINHFVKTNEEKVYDIITLGRLSSEKELGNFLKIVFLLTKTNSNIQVGIAGKGPEKEYLEKMIVNLHLGKNVKMLGFVNDLVDFYNSGKIFVLTSSTEGLARTVVESMACGIPCVASNVGDMEDVIDNDINGYLIQDYSDLNEFSKKINLLLNSKNIYENMSDDSIIKIRKNYSYEAATKVWEEIIDKVGD